MPNRKKQTTPFSFRMDEETRNVLENYADFLGVSLKDFLISSAMEKVEDEFDIMRADQALEDFNKNSETYTLEEMRKRHDV